MRFMGWFRGILAGFSLVLTSCSGNVNDSNVFQAHTVLVSLTDGNVQGNDQSYLGAELDTENAHNAVSSDGRYVAFVSKATNIIPSMTTSPERPHVYVRDMETRRTIMVDISFSGEEADNDSQSTNTNLITSSTPSISADGRYVAFSSNAVNLVSGGTTAGRTHVYRRDLYLGYTELVSIAHTIGGEGGSSGYEISNDPSVSSDGRYIAFESNMLNLVSGFNDQNDGSGPVVVRPDIFMRDMTLVPGEHTILVSGVGTNSASNATSGGTGASVNPSISANGTRIVFETGSDEFSPADSNLTTDIYYKDTNLPGDVVLVSRETGDDTNNSTGGVLGSTNGVISGDGNIIVFRSQATNLDPLDTSSDHDLYLRDISSAQSELHETRVITPQSYGNSLSDDPDLPSLDHTGSLVVFQSGSETLVTGDSNADLDIFLYNVSADSTVRVSVSTFGDEILGGSNRLPNISSDGRYIVWQSNSSQVVDNDLNSRWDVFRRGPLQSN